MSCHEIAALRLALATVLGRDVPGEREHDLAELGARADAPGPLAQLARARHLADARAAFGAAAADLDERVARTPDGDPELPYLRTLVVLCRKVELDLEAQIAALTRFHADLDAVHDAVHALYPGA